MSLISIVLEKKEKLFQRLARLLPAWLTPNMLTISRAVLIVPIYFLWRNNAFGWIIMIFIIGLITDVLDGVHARTNNTVTNLGKLLDPAADKVIFIGLFLLMAPGRLSQALLITLISLEGILVLLAVVIGPLTARWLKKPLQLGANLAGKIKMSLEGLATLVLLIGLDRQTIIHVSEGIFWLAAGCALLSIILHLNQTNKIQTPPDNHQAAEGLHTS